MLFSIPPLALYLLLFFPFSHPILSYFISLPLSFTSSSPHFSSSSHLFSLLFLFFFFTSLIHFDHFFPPVFSIPFISFSLFSFSFSSSTSYSFSFLIYSCTYFSILFFLSFPYFLISHLISPTVSSYLPFPYLTLPYLTLPYLTLPNLS